MVGRLFLFAVFSFLFFLTPAPSPGQPKGKEKPKYKNRLAMETSPYLLMHAHNPTDWYAWGPEAFAKAKKENKLIFLSIGYSSCYWCHVMERESFNNEEVAKILNESFVSIKVDREERPDIDQIYMTALNVLKSRGGWPLSMFLTPDGKPIVGGTYWPREDRKEDGEVYKGFKSILQIVRNAWKESPKDVEAQAANVAERTESVLLAATRLIALVPIDRNLIQEVADDLKNEFDKTYGGFGSAARKFQGPKFPMPCRLDFLLQEGQRTKDPELLAMVTLTLDKMAHGGIYDQLGGGFHRYSTERTWNVPHFEKMLYDNGQLMEVYARAYRATKNPLYRRIVAETLAYVERDMMSPEGAFYSSQDAETHHEEGRSYVWTAEELAAALPEKEAREFFAKVYGADGRPNFEGKFHILHLPRSLSDQAKDLGLSEEKFQARLKPLKEKVLKARDQREQPFLNKIALTAWSGLMIAGFAEAGLSLKEPKYLQTAARAADFLLKNQTTKDGRLLRTYGAAPGQKPRAQGSAYLEDYAFVVHGLLNLHDATLAFPGGKGKGSPLPQGGEGGVRGKWLEQAKRLTDLMIEHHGDSKLGGYYFTAHDHEKLFARTKDQYDGALPSPNGLASRNLVRLWTHTGDDRYRAEAERTFKAFTATLKTIGPASMCSLARGIDLFLEVKEKTKKDDKK